MEKVKNTLEKRRETLNKLLDTQPKMVDEYTAQISAEIIEEINQIEKALLILFGVVNCKHEDYTPCYGREGELMFKQCDTCGQEFD